MRGCVCIKERMMVFCFSLCVSIWELQMRKSVKACEKSTHNTLLRVKGEEKETIETQTLSQTIRPTNWILCFIFRFLFEISTTPKMSLYFHLSQQKPVALSSFYIVKLRVREYQNWFQKWKMIWWNEITVSVGISIFENFAGTVVVIYLNIYL